MRMVAGSLPVLVIAWEWHTGLALLCGCSGALEYLTTNSCRPINESLILILLKYFVAYSVVKTRLQEVQNRSDDLVMSGMLFVGKGPYVTGVMYFYFFTVVVCAGTNGPWQPHCFSAYMKCQNNGPPLFFCGEFLTWKRFIIRCCFPR